MKTIANRHNIIFSIRWMYKLIFEKILIYSISWMWTSIWPMLIYLTSPHCTKRFKITLDRNAFDFGSNFIYSINEKIQL